MKRIRTIVGIRDMPENLSWGHVKRVTLLFCYDVILTCPVENANTLFGVLRVSTS
jgi:hypothetical protein